MKTHLLLLLCAAGVGVAEAGSVNPAVTTNDLNNPHKGFMVWGTDYAAGVPNNHYGATIYHVYAPWREIETSDQVFDWGRFETNHILPILADHPEATFVLRPVADYPAGPASGISLFYTGGETDRDFPRFLIEAPLSIPYYPYTTCDGDGPGWTPDWNHPAMVTQLVQFVQALGQRYDGDPRITAVQVGLLGLWGEWHQSGCDARSPSNAVKVAVRDAYEAAFTNTPLQTRYPRDPDAVGVEFGFHEDYFPSFTAPCVYGFPSCDDSGDWSLSYCFANVTPASTNNWRFNPISGESPLTSQKRAWSNDFDDVMTVLRDYHFSFLGPAGGHERPGNQVKLNAMKRLLGYNLHVAHAEWPDELPLGGDLTVTLVLTNSGAAPCYHAFPVEVALCGTNGVPVWRHTLAIDLRTVMPGASVSHSEAVAVTNVAPGLYSLRVGILDPRTGEPGIRIQSAGEDALKRIELGPVDVVDAWTADTDGDGLPDGWELLHFGNATNAVPGADPDGDGQSNWAAYVSGSDPTNPASFFRVDVVPAAAGMALRILSLSNRLYSIDRATSLAGVWAGWATGISGTGGSIDLPVTNPAALDVYRARVSLMASSPP